MPYPYRKNVGIVIYNAHKKVLWCERKDLSGQWQFPQGGIDEGESVLEAAKRELREETSVTSVEPVAVIEKPLVYDFPAKIAEKFKKRGQAMNWVLFKFYGENSEINLKTPEPEFINWKWVDIDETPENIIQFKKDVYQKMVKEFKPYLQKDR
uniref:RNA pyrophosphohydrolase n=1 Tax=uncultured Alphaproteobacteria bacterium TaxID=91750 RepID=A0A6M4NP81_9PROT|nr:RNA pyrophosphohydrolase [uncultured Alphaproteobacteria bacterium]